jgi:hypothetical protein
VFTLVVAETAATRWQRDPHERPAVTITLKDGKRDSNGNTSYFATINISDAIAEHLAEMLRDDLKAILFDGREVFHPTVESRVEFNAKPPRAIVGVAVDLER